MSRVKPLSDNKIKALKASDKEYKEADGDGLYLHVKPNGSKLWRLRYSLNGKSSMKSLGQYPTVSLKDARLKRDEYRQQVASGIKPTDTTPEVESRTTFKDLAKEYIDHRTDLGNNYLNDIRAILKRDFYDVIGDMDLDSITEAHLLEVFKGMEKRGIKTMARKSSSLINRIFKYGSSMQYTKNNPMLGMDIGTALKKHKPKNFAHITNERLFKELLISIDSYVGDIYTRTALQFMPYAFVRPANIREMLWSEVDFKKRTWTIPAEKMKMKKEHVVPLTDSMIELLEFINDGRSKYVFPSPRSVHSTLSENTLNVGLKRLGFAGIMTSHGFRHTASTLLHESIHIHNIPSDVIEMQLAHVDKNNIKGVYNKALYMKERIKLMKWWSDYLDKLKIIKPAHA